MPYVIGKLKSHWSALPVLVEVIEGWAELCELLLADALGIPGEDLVLHLVDGAVDGGQELLPSHTEGLHCVLGIPECGKKYH